MQNNTSKETEGKINPSNRNLLINPSVNSYEEILRITRHLRKTSSTKWDQNENTNPYSRDRNLVNNKKDLNKNVNSVHSL